MFKNLYKIVAVLPFLSLISFYLFVLVIKVWFGEWPKYGSPDAGNFKGILWYFDVFVFLLAVLSFFSPVLRFFLRRKKSIVLSCENVCFYITYFVWLFLVFSDFGQFIDWYID